MINKQSENDHVKVLCVIFEVTSGNLQNTGVKKLKQTMFGHLPNPKFNTRVYF